MSELRNSRPPVPAMSGDAAPTAAVKATAPVKASKAPISAAKASKAAPARVKTVVPAVRNAKGVMLRCMVVSGRGQCANPGRHPVAGGFTCTTHLKAIAAGAKRTVRKSTATYVAPHAPIAQVAATAK